MINKITILSVMLVGCSDQLPDKFIPGPKPVDTYTITHEPTGDQTTVWHPPVQLGMKNRHYNYYRNNKPNFHHPVAECKIIHNINDVPHDEWIPPDLGEWE